MHSTFLSKIYASKVLRQFFSNNCVGRSHLPFSILLFQCSVLEIPFEPTGSSPDSSTEQGQAVAVGWNTCGLCIVLLSQMLEPNPIFHLKCSGNMFNCSTKDNSLAVWPKLQTAREQCSPVPGSPCSFSPVWPAFPHPRGLDCTAPHCTVLYCTVLYRTVQYCT